HQRLGFLAVRRGRQAALPHRRQAENDQQQGKLRGSLWGQPTRAWPCRGNSRSGRGGTAAERARPAPARRGPGAEEAPGPAEGEVTMASGSAFERAWEAFQQARYPGGVPPELSARRLTREFFRWGQRLANADPALSALWQEAIREAALPFTDG